MNMATLGGSFTLLNRTKVTNNNTGHKKQENSSQEGTELGSTSLATHTHFNYMFLNVQTNEFLVDRCEPGISDKEKAFVK